MGLRFGFCLAETTLTFLVFLLLLFFSTHYSSHDISRPTYHIYTYTYTLFALQLCSCFGFDWIILSSLASQFSMFLHFLSTWAFMSYQALLTYHVLFLCVCSPAFGTFVDTIDFYRRFPGEDFWLNIG